MTDALLGFGVDVWCLDSISTVRLARGYALLGQACYHRLITPRGALQGGDEEAAYGIDLAGYVGEVGYPTAIGALPGVIAQELLKDDRVQDVEVNVTAAQGETSGEIVLTVEIFVLPQGADASFPLTLRVTDVTVELLSTFADALPETA